MSIFRVEIPSYSQVLELSVEVEVSGADAELALTLLGTNAKEMMGSTRIGQVKPFAHMSEEDYAAWIKEFLRKKLSEHWWSR